MAKEMLINVSAGEECRIALLEDGKIQELYMERTSATSHVGNIYKGKVTNVEPSIQAAFVDFGIGRNGFLHISDLMPTYFGKKGGDYTEPVGQKLGRRDRPPIQQCLRKGDEIIVQIIKEGIGTKGPTLSTYLSIPGRVLVMMPGMAKMGISKKIEDEEERHRLRKILDGLKPPKDCGFIIRTAGIGKSKVEIERDLKYLARLWETLKKKIDKEKPPVELYTEGDLVTRTVRDVFTADVDQIVIDEPETAKKVKEFIKLAMPRTKNKVIAYDEPVPLFHKYDIEGEIEQIYSRRVQLPSGGSLVIDQTEAIVAIDVNSGKFRDHSDAETTAYKTDMEAADEIPRQLKLRDMGGVIICDFIDLRFERHRRDVEQRLYENLKNDRAKTRMLRMSGFGIIEMTRQRMRPSLKKSIYQECVACRAHGMVKTPESMSLDVTRKLRIALHDGAVVRVQVVVHPEVAAYLNNKKRSELATLEDQTGKRIVITSDASLPMDEVKFELYDARDGFIFIAELGMSLPTMRDQPRHGGGRGGRDGRDSHGRRDQGRPRVEKREEENDSIDAEELFSEADNEQPKKKEHRRALPAKAVPTEGGAAIEQTGGEDEASVVEIDEGGAELPGHAPDAFFENGEEPRYNQQQQGGGGRRRRRRRGRRGGRGGEDRQQGDQPREPRDENAPMDEGDEGHEGDEQAARPQGDRDQGARHPDDRGQRDRHQGDRNQGGRGQGDRPQGDRNQQNRGRDDRPQGDRPHGDRNQGDRGQRDRQGGQQFRGGGGGGGGGRDNRQRDNRDQRGGRRDGRDNRGPQQGRNDQRRDRPVSKPISADDIANPVYDDPDHPAPAPGNELSPDTSPEAQRLERDNAAKRGRGRRGGRGRGRGGGADRPRSGQVVDRSVLPSDEELAREEAALLAAEEARLAGKSSAGAEARGNRAAPKPRDDEDEGDEASGNEAPVAAAPPEKAKRTRTPAPRRTPPPQPPVVKTGTADKHLVDDEPIDEPVAPPSSFRELDDLPDFDE